MWVMSGGHKVDIGGMGPHSQFCWSSISSSSSWLGFSALLLVETLDAIDNTAWPCLNFLAVGPHPPYVPLMLLMWWMLPGLFHFAALPLSYIIVNTNQIALLKLGCSVQSNTLGCSSSCHGNLGVEVKRFHGNPCFTQMFPWQLSNISGYYSGTCDWTPQF